MVCTSWKNLGVDTFVTVAFWTPRLQNSQTLSKPRFWKNVSSTEMERKKGKVKSDRILTKLWMSTARSGRNVIF